MKLTVELPDDLLIEAKAVALRRRTTLQALFKHALRRELAPTAVEANPDSEKFEVGPLGFLVLKRAPGEIVSLEQIKSLQAELDEREFASPLHPRA